MSNELTIFNNDKFGAIRTITDEKGEPWFCGKDVATALGYVDTDQALRNHCKEGGALKRRVIDSLGREQDTIFINEGNLYRLIMRSKLPSAEEFEKWVCEEVLPTIRKTGSYSLTKSNMDIAIYSEDPLERGEAIVAMLKEERAKQLVLTQQKEKAITERAMMQEAFSRAIVSDKDVGYTDFITRLKMTTQCACSLLKELNIFGKKGPLADFGEWFKTEPNKDGFPARFVTPLGQEKLIGLFNNNRDKMIAVNGTYRYIQPKNRVKQITLLPKS